MPEDWLSREEDLTVNNLGRLLARMALDEDLHREFLEDPEKVIEDAGLSEDEAKALRDGDWSVIKTLLGPSKPRNLQLSKGGGG